MPLLDGKQLRNSSIKLSKADLSGSQGSFIFATGSSIGSYQSPQTDFDYANKLYVDSISAGLDPKASVAYTTTGTVSLSGTATQPNGDWSIPLTVGQRILVKDQIGSTANGIYTAAAGAWSRASDSDGSPSNEVSLGNFTFVELGVTYSGRGFVLYSSNTGTTPSITPNTDTQLWTQFSSAGAYIWGDGLESSGNTVNVGAGTGLQVSATAVSISNTTVAAGSYGSNSQATLFTVNAQGQLTAASTQSISITSTQVSDFTSAAESAIFTDANFVDGSTVTFSVTAGASITAEVTVGSLTASRLNSSGGATAGYVLSVLSTGQFNWVDPSLTGDITGVTAGAGLTGGGSSGFVTLAVNTNNGLSISNDEVVFGGTLSTDTVLEVNDKLFTIKDTGTTGTTLSVIFDSQASSLPDEQILIKAQSNVNLGYIDVYGSGVSSTYESTTAISRISVNSLGSVMYASSGLTTSQINISLAGAAVGAGDATTNNHMIVTDQYGKGLIYAGNYTGNFTTFSLVSKNYVDNNISNVILGVTAGAGISGGGTQGDVTVAVETTINKGLSFSAAGDAGTLEAYLTPLGGLTFSSGGIAPSVDGTTLAVNAGGQLYAISTGDITGVTAGAGLTGAGNSGAITISIDTTINKGLTLSAAGNDGTLEAYLTPLGGLTFSSGGIAPSVDTSTITVNAGGQLTLASGLTSGTPVYSQRNVTPTATSGNGASTGVTLTFTPNDSEHVSVYVNGQLQYLGDGASASVDCYFSTSPATANAITALASGDTLYWNGTVAGFDLSTTDRLDIIYNK